MNEFVSYVSLSVKYLKNVNHVYQPPVQPRLHSDPGSLTGHRLHEELRAGLKNLPFGHLYVASGDADAAVADELLRFDDIFRRLVVSRHLRHPEVVALDVEAVLAVEVAHALGPPSRRVPGRAWCEHHGIHGGMDRVFVSLDGMDDLLSQQHSAVLAFLPGDDKLSVPVIVCRQRQHGLESQADDVLDSEGGDEQQHHERVHHG